MRLDEACRSELDAVHLFSMAPELEGQGALPIAASAPAGRAGGIQLDERNATSYVEMTCRSILNWVQSRRIGEVFTVNPYRGCEFGCAYCYARYTHEFLDLPDWLDFERKIFVKTNAAAAMRRDLRRSDVHRYGIAIGTATDPYQPAERRFHVTRRILESLLPLRGISISLVTKSGLVEHDADLLGELARRHTLHVKVSCVTTDAELQRALEPRAHVPSRRFAAMAKLVAAGVSCGVLVAPVLPGITDSELNLRSVLMTAKESGASSFGHTVLFLTDSSKKRFYPWLQENVPELFARYASRYASGIYETDSYRDLIYSRIQRLAVEAGLLR
jgi:DNA repair photolyase